MEKDEKKKLRHQSFWNAPNTRLQGDPNIQHNKWNPYENKEIELDYD